ncbi:MAG TPA: Ig-like domain-containing protein, partial [Candidatus Sulfotelmatobacter sp.]|nr:Ig-like domain-containing protein [Candidatus Sulfotelmatobacter sp.]
MKINNYLPAFTAVLLSVVAVCLINISMVGCAKVAAPEASPDSTPPTVVTTSPTNGATGVAINTKISATFSKTIDPSTAVAANFTLTSTAGAVTGSISYDAPSKTATFTPAANLGYSLTYTASISAVIKDITGNRMAAAYHWSFTTGNNPDTTPPTVVSVAPANGATRVATTTTVEATFCEAMDPSTINAANFTLDHGVTGIVSYDAVNKSAIFTPSSNLIYSTAYTATITTGVKDLAGNAMAANYSWTFTAKPQPGTLDTSFNGTGMATTDVHSSNYNEANGMAVQTDDKIVLAGSVQLFGNNEFALVRYNSDGTLDTSFHYIGKVHTSVGNG